MEPQSQLSKFSVLKLRGELKRLEKRRNALLAAFPYLEDGSASLMALYLKPSGSHVGGPVWDEYAAVNSHIEELKLELIRRDQAPNSRGLQPLPARMEATPPVTGAAAAEAEQPKRVDATPPVSAAMERGKFCQQVTDEIKKIKNLCLGTGRSVAEIQNEHPDWAVWKLRESLSSEDQDTFNHPRRWEAPVGYARFILSKVQGVSRDTIKSWTKAYRRSLRMK